MKTILLTLLITALLVLFVGGGLYLMYKDWMRS